MVMEVSCGQCSGRLLVETAGVVVACPHCGVHLSIPLPDDDPEVSVPTNLGVDLPMVSVVSEPVPQSQRPVSDVGAQLSPAAQTPPSDATETLVGIGSQPEPLPLPPAPVIVSAPTSSIFGGPEDDQSSPNPSSDLSAFGESSPAQTNSDSQQFSPQTPVLLTTPVVQMTSAVADTPTIPAGLEREIEWTARQTPMPSSVPQLASTDQPAGPEMEQTILHEIGWGSSPNLAPVAHLDSPPATIPAEPAPSLDSSSQSTNPFAGLGSDVVASGSWPAPSESSSASPFSFETSNTPEAAPAIDNGTFARPGPAAANSTFEELRPQPAMPASSAAFQIADAVDARQSKLSMALLIIGSYASLLTIYVVYLTVFGRKHQLESLPDLKTVQQSGGRASVPRPENDLPPGHQLRLGESQRYGNIRVTPIRVTQGPITFQHFSGANAGDRAPSDPVLKLWLKFENLSDRQTIVPLDTTLMFFQRFTDNHVASYNVIFREADRKNRQAQFHYLFDSMAVDSEWNMVGQHTNEELAPGQSFETFVPSETDTGGLTGDLVWRVHFRKGYGPQTGNGVTTLIDVLFNLNDVKPDPA